MTEPSIQALPADAPPLGTPIAPAAPRLLTLVAELTYSCPLRCAYCSNPVHVGQRDAALSTDDWLQVIEEAGDLGALHVHFTGGEPLLCKDLVALVRRARKKQFYTNLITSGTPLSFERLEELRAAGLDHVQLSFQAVTRESNLRIAGVDAIEQKVQVARWTKALGLALTVNIVVHKQNLSELPQLIALAETFEPHRIELANAQYLGWALLNRENLLPSASELELARNLAQAAQTRLHGKIDVLSVLPDYYANRPRPCMQGWAQSYAVVTPDGLVLPCHAARDLPGIVYDNVRASSLSQIWTTSEGLNRFRGNDWYPEPCRGCAERDKDYAGCRCQALALTGDATAADPTCSRSPSHQLVRIARARAEQSAGAAPLVLRRAPRSRVTA